MFPFKCNPCRLFYVCSKKLLLWVYFLKDSTCPFTTAIRTKKKTLFHLLLDLRCVVVHQCFVCGYETALKLLRVAIEQCQTFEVALRLFLWSIVSIPLTVFLYPSVHSKSKPLSLVICLWLPRSCILSILDQQKKYGYFSIVSKFSKLHFYSGCSTTSSNRKLHWIIQLTWERALFHRKMTSYWRFSSTFSLQILPATIEPFNTQCFQFL